MCEYVYVYVWEEAGDEHRADGSEDEDVGEGEAKELHRMVCDDDSGGRGYREVKGEKGKKDEGGGRCN